jgi:4-hydroxyphenylpyruvate dioxygenase
MSLPDVPLRKIDHLRFFVGNARQSAFFYRNAFGFEVAAYAGLETRVKHEAGYVLKQGEITFVLTSPLGKDHSESQRLLTHGDGVMDIALDVPDVRAAFAAAVQTRCNAEYGPSMLASNPPSIAIS